MDTMIEQSPEDGTWMVFRRQVTWHALADGFDTEAEAAAFARGFELGDRRQLALQFPDPEERG